MITIRQPLSFSEIGKKDKQEDYLFPSRPDKDTRVFVLCDGMGGHDCGELASSIAANTIGARLAQHELIDTELFESALSEAYDALDAIDTFAERKPGTTLTCLCINSDSCLAAHIGDSRIYHIRPSLFDKSKGQNGILYQSVDHSLVNQLLKLGELTEEEAAHFPRKNVITRAMQPHLANRYEADVTVLTDIKSGDYFFLCCDGVLEQVSNDLLCEILANRSLSDDKKIEAIKSHCDNQTYDNYSCWLIPIDKASLKADITAEKSRVIVAQRVEDHTVPSGPISPKEENASDKLFNQALKIKYIAIGVAIGIAGTLCTSAIFNRVGKTDDSDNPSIQPQSVRIDTPDPTNQSVPSSPAVQQSAPQKRTTKPSSSSPKPTKTDQPENTETPSSRKPTSPPETERTPAVSQPTGVTPESAKQ